MTRLAGKIIIKIIKLHFANFATPIVIDEIVAKR
jgi:hypothetical protein